MTDTSESLALAQWLKGEIATIERHVGRGASLTLEAFRLALERLEQIEAKKPKETVGADKIAALLNASHGQSTLEISKRILREIVQPMIVEAFVQGRENKEFSSEYAHRIIAQACGEKE